MRIESFLHLLFIGMGVLVQVCCGSSPAGAATAPSILIVKLADGASAEEQTAVVARCGGVETAVISALRIHVVSVPADDSVAALLCYQSDQQVERAEFSITRKAEGVAEYRSGSGPPDTTGTETVVERRGANPTLADFP